MHYSNYYKPGKNIGMNFSFTQNDKKKEIETKFELNLFFVFLCKTKIHANIFPWFVIIRVMHMHFFLNKIIFVKFFREWGFKLFSQICKSFTN